MNTFNPKTLGCTAAILWGLCLFLCALGGVFFSWGLDMIDVMSSVYIGYDATFVGALLGLVYGLIEGFVAGYLFGWLYNRCLNCGFCCKKGN